MQKKIEAIDITYGEFHKRASEMYYIPSLQRPYSWGKKEVGKLWNDIIQNDYYYYIGSVVVVTSDGTVNPDQIIDGQQRLTTLSLILIAIRNYISGNNKKVFSNVEEDIDEFLMKFSRKEEVVRLSFSNKNSNQVYSAAIKSQDLSEFKTDTQKRFIKNLDYINQKLLKHYPDCKLNEIQDLISRIKNLQLIFIKCQDKSSAYKLFESINATGINLATTDMIKNSIFESLHRNQKSLKFVEKGWKEMYEVFGEDGSYLKKYIRHHWISTVGYTSHSHLFDDFLNIYKSEKDILSYVKSLFDLSTIYVALRDGSVEALDKLTPIRYEIGEIKETLKFLSYLGVDQIYSVLLFCYTTDPKSFKKDLIRFSAFQFLYKYLPGNPSVPEKKYFANFCAKKINKEDVWKGLFQLCENQEIHFKKKFIEKIKYTDGRSGDVQYILEKYLYYKGGADKFARPTIEHIISQDLSDDSLKKFNSEKKDVIKKMHQLGNLTILELKDNSSTDRFNKPFAEKKFLYGEHIFWGNRDILNYDFDKEPEKAILRRGEDVASAVYAIFLDALKSGKWKTEVELNKK